MRARGLWRFRVRGAGDRASVPGALGEVGALLAELDELARASAGASARGAASAADRAASQRRVDEILRVIDGIAGAGSFDGTRAVNRVGGYETTNVSADVERFNVYDAAIPDGEALDLEVEVTQSAQAGGFFLSFGQASLDLAGAGEVFVIELGSPSGSRTLTFVSGTDLGSIADAINLGFPGLGLEARASGTGVRIVSREVGSDAFTSVQVLEDGGFGSASGGIYGLRADDANAAGSRLASFEGAPALKDAGQDVAGTINGVAAVGRGAGLSVDADGLTARLLLGVGEASGAANAQTLGSFTALSVSGGAGAGLLESLASGARERILSLTASAGAAADASRGGRVLSLLDSVRRT